ncbi:unnamed protein product [Ectocarpus sp. CCAP 1310/34]|nr:unnamed protein product [Ectocarpus sp. CCAP 1310/34]
MLLLPDWPTTCSFKTQISWIPKPLSLQSPSVLGEATCPDQRPHLVMTLSTGVVQPGPPLEGEYLPRSISV